jgi:hypothetical protein
MKFKVITYDKSVSAYIILDRDLSYYLAATGCKFHSYHGGEPEAQRGKWAGEMKFGCKEDAYVFAQNHIPRAAKEIEEVTKEIERDGGDS